MAPDGEPARSQRSTSVGGGGKSDCDDAMADAPSSRTTATTDQDTECLLLELFESYEIVNAYLEEKRAPDNIQAALDTVVEIVRRVVSTLASPSRTEEAIRTLQQTVQKLADRIEASDKAPDRPQTSYAAVAATGAPKRPVIIPTL